MNNKITALLAALLLSLVSATAFAKTRLVVNCFWPPKHFACTEILPNWVKEVERVTDGRVTGVIPPKTIAPPPEQLASVEKGLADVAVQFSGLIGNRVSGPIVAMQPFVAIRNAEHASRALWETNRKFFPAEFTTVQLLSQFVISPAELFSQNDAPINSVGDLASRKMWVLPGPLAAIAKNLGAGVVSSPAVQASETISRGVVDGHLGLDPQAIRAFQLMPYTTSNTQFSKGIFTASFSVFINKDKWAQISDEDKQAILGVSGATLGAKFGARWDKAAAAAEATYANEGIAVVKADAAFEKAMVDAAKPITAGWIKKANAAGIDGQAALDFYSAKLAEYK